MEKVQRWRPRRKICKSKEEPEKCEYVAKFGYIPMTLRQWETVSWDYKGEREGRKSTLAFYPSLGTTSQPVVIVSANKFRRMRRAIIRMPLKFLVTVRVRENGGGGFRYIFRIRTGEDEKDAMRRACQGYDVLGRHVELKGRFIFVHLPITP